MIYKLYIMKMKEGFENIEEDTEAMEELYNKHDVEVVGEWVNKDNPLELYFLTGYQDDEHYKKFTEAAQQNKAYQEINMELSKMREDIEMVNLVPFREEE